MKHTIKRMLDKINKECLPDGRDSRNGLNIQYYLNKKNNTRYAVAYDTGVIPNYVEDISHNLKWNRDEPIV